MAILVDSIMSSDISSMVSRPGICWTRFLIKSGVSPVGPEDFLFFRRMMANLTSAMVGTLPNSALGSLPSIRSSTVGSYVM